MRSILVAGGSSFSGRALLPRLLERDYNVHVVARGDMNATPHPHLHWHRGSLGDRALVESLLNSCDALLHVASVSTPGTSAREPTTEARGNIDPTLRLIELLQHHPRIHVVYTSSGGAIYGNPESSPVSEDTPCRPISYYGAAKLAVESFLRVLHAGHGGRTTILRPANFYGPGQTHRRGFGLIRTILQRIQRGENIELWGDGTAVRDFLYIEDFVDACLAVLDGPTLMDQFSVYNIGTGYGHSLNTICDIVQEVTGVPVHRSYRPARASDVRAIVLDSTLIANRLGWAPRTNLYAGIEATWKWLQSATP